MIISHNIQAMNTNRLANANINLYGRSLEKVSSGYKINHVGDNPVGLAISETMRRQVRGLNQGVENTKAAINFCQVADGALNEVTEMLQRMNKLAVQAENGTNTLSDRCDIQAEVKQLLMEIDRIADTTAFNEIPVFKGTDETIVVPPDDSVVEGDISFSDFTINNVLLGRSPFGPNSGGNYLNLQAIVNNPDSSANGRQYNLIYGSGSTSSSSFRLTYQKADGNTVKTTVNMGSLSPIPTEYETGIDNNGYSWWKRNFKYENADGVKIKITQHVTAIIPEDLTQEKKYNISYSFANMSDSQNVTLDFMFHADTAYNNNDICEGYFINDGNGNGSRLDKTCMFTDGGNWSGSDPVIPDGTTNENISSNLPNSFSIIDVDNALPFSEKISFVQGSEPNALSLGYYHSIRDWSYYNQLDTNLGQNAIRRDLGFSLFWNQNINSGDATQLSFNYGIISYRDDDNLSNVTINKNPNVIGDKKPHYITKNLWIQSGYEKGSGLWLEIDEMNTEVLGIDKLDLKTIEGAADANTRVKEALHKLATSRSKIGAQQNRLEHIVANEDNISEQVSGADSLIRDTDLSSEMVRYSNLSILLQMGQNMIAEADQRIQKIWNVLQ